MKYRKYVILIVNLLPVALIIKINFSQMEDYPRIIGTLLLLAFIVFFNISIALVHFLLKLLFKNNKKIKPQLIEVLFYIFLLLLFIIFYNIIFN